MPLDHSARGTVCAAQSPLKGGCRPPACRLWPSLLLGMPYRFCPVFRQRTHPPLLPI